MTFIKIEKFLNGFGEVRYRFATVSILHPEKLNRSLRSWKTHSGARRAAIRSLPRHSLATLEAAS